MCTHIFDLFLHFIAFILCPLGKNSCHIHDNIRYLMKILLYMHEYKKYLKNFKYDKKIYSVNRPIGLQLFRQIYYCEIHYNLRLGIKGN